MIEARLSTAAATFIGPKRGPPGCTPVRELTFQALKPNPPHKWKVVVFGPRTRTRVPRAPTGIAMFDNAFGDWADSQFGKVITIRCIIKAAAMWKYKIPKATPIADIPCQENSEETGHGAAAPEWFQAMLTQGVLLLNAAAPRPVPTAALGDWISTRRSGAGRSRGKSDRRNLAREASGG